MKKTKKVLSLILVVTMLVAFSGIATFASDGQLSPYAAETQTKTKTWTFNFYEDGTKLATLKVAMTGSYSSRDGYCEITSFTRTWSGIYSSDFSDGLKASGNPRKLELYYHGTSLGTFTFQFYSSGSMVLLAPTEYYGLSTINIDI